MHLDFKYLWYPNSVKIIHKCFTFFGNFSSSRLAVFGNILGKYLSTLRDLTFGIHLVDWIDAGHVYDVGLQNLIDSTSTYLDRQHGSQDQDLLLVSAASYKWNLSRKTIAVGWLKAHLEQFNEYFLSFLAPA